MESLIGEARFDFRDLLTAARNHRMTESEEAISIDKLLDLIDPKNSVLLAEIGGVEKLAVKLKSSVSTGLNTSDTADLDSRRALYGQNILPEPAFKTLLQFVWDALQDKMLIVLIIATLFELIIGFYKFFYDTRDTTELVDDLGILVAVLVVVAGRSYSDFRKQGQFQKLYAFGKSLKKQKILRNSTAIRIDTSAILVGDVALMETGDIFPADGILIAGSEVEVDESTITGEPMSVKKDTKDDPFLISGTKLVKGTCSMLVIATGINSLHGRSMLALELEGGDTPLQQKLGRLADAIAKYALIGACSLVSILLVLYLSINNLGQLGSATIASDIIGLLIMAVTVVVVAVPEGLPLAVTLALAQATSSMLKDNNLVRNLAACETMGNATTICSDKTGTLTANKMTIVRAMILKSNFDLKTSNVKAFFDGLTKSDENSESLSHVLALIASSLNVNSSVEELKSKSGVSEMTGSKTDIAIMDFFALAGFRYANDRSTAEVLRHIPFSSAEKQMTSVVRLKDDSFINTKFNTETHNWIFVKGAAEIILKNCSYMLSENADIVPITAKDYQYLEKLISSYADLALRTICAALKPAEANKTYKDTLETVPDKFDLILVAIFGIEDPLREEVPKAVADCQAAGIMVRMVTGESMEAAKAIARDCGILSADGIAMEGPVFRLLSIQEMDNTIPKLQVLARSSPLDKQILVCNLMRLGETVAVTGGKLEVI